jgi:hypothetical protein
MNLELAKLLILIVTLIVLIFKLFSDNLKIKNEHLFIVSSILVTLMLIIVIYLKLHHFLRSEFNILNTITYLIVSIPFLYHFYKFRYNILNSNYSFLIISLLFIGFGLLLDLLTDPKILVLIHSDYIEEILRIAGIFFWMLYYIFYSFRIRKD